MINCLSSEVRAGFFIRRCLARSCSPPEYRGPVDVQGPVQGPRVSRVGCGGCPLRENDPLFEGEVAGRRLWTIGTMSGLGRRVELSVRLKDDYRLVRGAPLLLSYTALLQAAQGDGESLIIQRNLRLPKTRYTEPTDAGRSILFRLSASVSYLWRCLGMMVLSL